MVKHSKHLPRAIRTQQLLDAALKAAQKHGIFKMRRQDIAGEIGVTPALVSFYLGTMTSVQRAVVRHAVHERNLPVIAEAITRKSPYVKNIPDELRQAVAAHIAAG